jgi:tRNA (guanosine-2'-O-)-methyltransferase
MDDVYQFRNAAAIIRSVEACAFHKVVAMEEENIFDPNLTVTKGAETWVEVEKMPKNIASLQNIKDRGYKILAVSLEKNAVMLPDYQIKEPIALVFGTEMAGVSEEVIDFADETLAIPMYGFTRSFNLSVASNLDYKLSDEKLLKMKIRWAVNSMQSGQQIFEKYLRDHHLKI